MNTREEQKKMEYIGADCAKLTCELLAAMRGKPINDIPIEAFLPEDKEEEIL